MDKMFISDLKDKDRVDTFFILRKKVMKLTKYDKPYLELGFSDKTGKIEGRLWDDADKYNAAVDTGDVVRVIGMVDKYRETKQLKVDAIDKADDRAYSYEDMVRIAENREEILSNVVGIFYSITNPWIKKLFSKFIEDKDFIDKFKEGLGGKSWHNAYPGGLMEHTYEVMFIADKMCELYKEADRNVTLFGAFIHDIGKVYELDPMNMEYTVAGGLIGHISLGHKLLISKMKEVPEFPPDLALRLEHIILSHHGEYVQQSPVLPKTLEATIVYQTDELVSQANAIKEIQVSQAEEGKVWSNFVAIKGRKYYIKDSMEESWKQGSQEKGDSSGKSEDNVDLFNL